VARIALPVAMFVGSMYWLVKPMLPDPGLTNAKIEVIRRNDAGADLSQVDLSYLGPSIAQEAKGGGKYTFTNKMEFRTDDRNQVRILLIIDDDRPIPHEFLLPREGDAIYRQAQGQWREERAEARKSKLALELSSRDSGRISLQLKGPCCSSMAQSFAPYRQKP
jgi:hypothetical protein